MNTPKSPAMVEVDRLPELPKPATIALFEGHCMQGPEIRGLADSYEPGCAQYTAKQMRAYATEAIAAERAEVVRMRKVAADALNFMENMDPDSSFNPPTASWAKLLTFELRAALATPTQGAQG